MCVYNTCIYLMYITASEWHSSIKEEWIVAQFRSCVKVEVAVLGHPSLIIRTVSGRKVTLNSNLNKNCTLHGDFTQLAWHLGRHWQSPETTTLKFHPAVFYTGVTDLAGSYISEGGRNSQARNRRGGSVATALRRCFGDAIKRGNGFDSCT